MMQMFAIANCDTVKKARNFLDQSKLSYEFLDFKKIPPNKEQILKWADFFGELPVNKKGTTYKKFKDEYETLSESKKIQFIIEHTSIIKRPILEKKGKVVAMGFSEEEYKKIK